MMAEEKQGGSSRSRRRKSKRRYFRRRKTGEEQEDGSKKSRSKSNERSRNDRKRRSKKRRSRSARQQKPSGPSIIDEINRTYTPPESVFIYTHVVRREQRDAPYEFRPEHFAHTGRRMEDFRINLTSLYDDILDPQEAPSEVQDELQRIAEERGPQPMVDIWADFSEDDYMDDEPPAELDQDAADAGQEK